MKFSAIILSAIAMSAVAAPSLAATVRSDTGVKAVYDAKHDKYCVSQEITGQRIPVRDCRSKADWAKDGAIFGENAPATSADSTKLAQK